MSMHSQHSHKSQHRWNFAAAMLLLTLSISMLTGCVAFEKKPDSEPVVVQTKVSEPVAPLPVAAPLPVVPPMESARPVQVKKPNLTVPKKKVTAAGSEKKKATASAETPECHTAKDGRRYMLDGRVRVYAPCQ